MQTIIHKQCGENGCGHVNTIPIKRELLWECENTIRSNSFHFIDDDDDLFIHRFVVLSSTQ